ncbi:MAG: glycosyltransferase family 4 protein [Bacteroidetes bacterium]|nr:glycosyltransferase family 4 protein [Bacteroidota bacterium]HET6244019.1 glycosyltransferase family 4 protein [Bacteroidia bacterium]
MNILYISYDGMTDQLGQSQVLPYLMGLSGKGYKITLISCEKPSTFQKGRKNIESIISNNIFWIPIPYSNKYPIFSQALTFLSLKKKVFTTYKNQGFDIVHCRSYMVSLIGLELKKKYGTKFIFDMRGFWADERLEGDIWRLSNPIHKFLYYYFKEKENEFLANADQIVSLTHAAKREILQWEGLNIPSENISVIPCCTDLNLFSNDINTEKFKEFTLTYLGSLGTWYMLTEMLVFFKHLLVFKPQANFLFITKDPAEKILIKARELNIPEHLIRIKPAERKEVPALLSKSHVSIFFIKPVFSKKASSPTKMGEIIATGIPLITNSGTGDIDEIIQETGCGIVVKSFEENELKKVAEEIDSLLEIPVEKLRSTAKELFSLEKGIETYNTIYKKLGLK